MANDCLVTKLKSVVDNNALGKLGEVKVLVGLSSNNKYYVGVKNTEGCVIRANSAILRVENSGAEWTDSVNIPANTYVPVELKERGYVFVSNYYSIQELYVSRAIEMPAGIQYFNAAYNIDINTVENVNLGVCPQGLTTLRISNVVGNAIINFKDNETYSMRNLYLDIATGNLTAEKVKNQMPDIINLVNYGDSAALGGNFSDLGSCVNLSSIKGTLCTGTIESFVAAARTAGRETGKITTEWLGAAGGITFNGNAIRHDGTVRTLSWTATTITYEGTTIDA